MAWAVAALLLLVSMRFGMRGLLFAMPLALLIIWSSSRKQQQARAQEPSGGRRRGGEMTREEALRVLGLEEGASPDAIAMAHRELVKKLHPDHGGSSFLTQQVNEAKQVLLKR